MFLKLSRLYKIYKAIKHIEFAYKQVVFNGAPADFQGGLQDD